MGIDDLKKHFEKSVQVAQFDFGPNLAAPIRHRLKGVAGSALSFVAAAAFKKNEVHQVLVFNDREEAAYFYNDLQNLISPNRVFFLPHSGKKPYEHNADELEAISPRKKEGENGLMRAEVLNALNMRKRHFVIVTYAEALSELVITKQNLVKNTLAINMGDALSQDFVNEMLQELEFERTDFVYQPGQYAIRGGIIDIWSFSNERPYRIELFGEEVDSLRTFDPVTQLSVKEHGHISIIPDVQKQAKKETRQTFLEYLPDSSVIWLKNFELIQEHLKKAFAKAQEIHSNLKTNVKQLDPSEIYSSEARFLENLLGFTQVEFDRPSAMKPDVEIRFNQTPQVSFNKNFDLLMNDLSNHEHNGFKNYIFASNPKQITRLHQIFEDIIKNRSKGEIPFEFEGINTAIHEGFVDHDLKLVCYTDHQLFERYHRYRLKEGFNDADRQLTLKELTDL
ncbi:MAG: transcription-repair coupling factor, partial [Salibacteraceae bacterium]|nr:transcription-repair coupling factor [Salibacteraceae bacterium]